MKTHSLQFEAWELSEPDGGGITSIILGYMSSEAEALKWKYDDYSWPRYIRKVTIVKHYVVYDSLAEYKQGVDKLKLDRVLEKLTPEERKILGY